MCPARVLALLLVLLLGWSAPCHSQYMYLDANGDGINNATDHLNAVGTTIIDVWLNTNHTRSGATVSCPQGAQPLSMSSYEVALRASNGTINWGSYINSQPSMTTSLGLLSDTLEYHNGFGGTSYLPPGLYKLGSLTVSIRTGNPVLLIVPSLSLDANVGTSFGGECSGAGFDNSMVLGTDWSDVDGILITAPTLVPNLPVMSSKFETIEAGVSPKGVAVGDFNRDGRPDVVWAGTSTSTGVSRIGISLAQNDGSYRNYSAPTLYTAGNTPGGLVVGDFDADGKLDLVSANSNGGTVSIFTGNGDGTFDPKTDFSAGSAPTRIAAADFNLDGKLDVAVTNNLASGTVSVLLGNGNATFAAPVSYATEAFPEWIVAAPLGEVDQVPDLVTKSLTSGKLSVFRNNGNGTFKPRVDFNIAAGSGNVAVAQLVGSLALDIVVGGSWVVSVFPGITDSTLGTRADYPSSASKLVISDFNGDTKRDIVTGGDRLFAFLNNGTGGFSVGDSSTASPFIADLVAGELNGDGYPDIVAASSNSTVTLYRGKGNGAFGTSPSADAMPNGGPTNLAMGDVNGDGKQDVVVSHYNSTSVSLLLGSGTGSFGSRADISQATTESVALTDISNDGKLDLITTHSAAFPGTNLVSVRRGNGDGTFGTRSDYTTASDPQMVAVGDFNNDALQDLAVAASGNVSVFLAVSSGNYGAKTDYAKTEDSRWILARDMNADGKLDLVVGRYNANQGGGLYVSILYGNGNGTFGTEQQYWVGHSQWGLAAGDLTGDGKPDIVCALETNQVAVLINTGSGFALPTNVTVGAAAKRIVLADMNGDANLDIVTANTGAASVSVVFGVGNGTFSARHDFGCGPTPEGIAVGNLNGTGLPDIAIITSELYSMVVSLVNEFRITDVLQTAAATPRMRLDPNHPNPFNPSTTITFVLPAAAHTEYSIFDARGRLIVTLVDGIRPAGINTLHWSGSDRLGHPVPSGVYFGELRQGGESVTRKLVLIR